MTHWNYRIVRTINEENERHFQVAEVYYDKKDRPTSYCDISIAADTQEGLLQDLAWITTGLTKPVLEYPKDFNGKMEKP